MRCSRRYTALSALICVTSLGVRADEPPLLEEKLPLGAPPREVAVVLTRTDETLQLRVDGRPLKLPWTQVATARAEAIQLNGDAAILRIVAQSDTGEAQALIGGRHTRQLLWEGRAGLHGDPGERQGMEVTVVPTESGQRVLLRRRAEALSTCDGTPLWLEAHEVDAQRLTLKAASEALPLGAQEWTAQPLDALTPASPLRLLRESGASDPSGQGPQSPPPRLDDGDRATAVQSQRGANQLFWRAQFHGAGFPIRRLELAAPAKGRLPGVLHVELGKGQTVQLKLDPAAPLQAVELPEPVEPRCLSLRAQGKLRPGTGVGELRAVTDLHVPEPAVPLAKALVEETAGAAEAARMLKRLGAAGAQATLAVWADLSTLGKRRGLPVLAPFLGEPEVLATVAGAAREPGLTEPAVEILAASQGPGRDALEKLAQDDGAVGAAALAALGANPGNAAALLRVLSAQGGHQRSRVRKALASQARLDAAALLAAAETWLPTAGDPARAALAQAVAGSSPRLTPLVETACQQATAAPEAAFEERYRCALALARLPAGPQGDAWLRAQATSADEWMQRREALSALRARQSPVVTAVATGALSDGTPRVRAEAARALSAAGASPALRALAETDPWPVVREAAVTALADDTEARDVLRGRVADPSRGVREAAIVAVTAQRDADAWPHVQKRLEKEREFPGVRTAAIRYAQAMCVEAAAPALRDLLARGLGPEADSSDVTVSIEALRALRSLGGETRQATERWLTEQGAPAGLGKAAGEPPSCQPTTQAAPPTS